GAGLGLQSRYSAGGFLLGQRSAVPAFLVLNERDAGAFHGPGYDGERLFPLSDGPECLKDILHVVAIDERRAPAKSVETRAVSLEFMTEGCRLALAKTIPIDQRNQIVQMVNARDRGGLPNGQI